MKKKAIVFTRFPYESAFGGEESHTLTLAKYFKSLGFEPIFFGSCPVLFDAFCKSGFTTVRVWGSKMIVTPWQLLISLILFPFIWWNLRKQFKQLLKSFDITAAVFLSLNEKLFLTRFAIQHGIRVIWMEHQEIRAWLLKNPWKWLFKRNAKLVNIVPISPGNCLALTDQLHIDPAHINNIVHGVEIPDADLSERRTEKNLVVSSARLILKKGMMDFLKAIEQLKKFTPPLHVVLIGEGEEEEKLKKFVDQHLHGMNVEFYHFLKKEKWFELLEHADIFVLPSRDASETFSLSAAEAMARGCKLVVTRCSGIAGFLHDRYDAFIAEPNSPDSLKRQIEAALASSEEIRSHAVETVQTKCNLKRMLEQYKVLILQP